jgi:hypothetical protein
MLGVRTIQYFFIDLFTGRFPFGEFVRPWDNLFVDKQAGLTRLGDATEAALADVAPPDHVRDWRRQGQFAPADTNFKAWIPTAQGIELHFPEFQFGGGLKVVTVPWATVTDQIKPEFTPITGG